MIDNEIIKLYCTSISLSFSLACHHLLLSVGQFWFRNRMYRYLFFKWVLTSWPLYPFLDHRVHIWMKAGYTPQEPSAVLWRFFGKFLSNYCLNLYNLSKCWWALFRWWGNPSIHLTCMAHQDADYTAWLLHWCSLGCPQLKGTPTCEFCCTAQCHKCLKTWGSSGM